MREELKTMQGRKITEIGAGEVGSLGTGRAHEGRRGRAGVTLVRPR